VELEQFSTPRNHVNATSIRVAGATALIECDQLRSVLVNLDEGASSSMLFADFGAVANDLSNSGAINQEAGGLAS